MKKYNLLFIMVAAFTLLLAACGDSDKDTNDKDTGSDTTESAYEPEDIDPDSDVCEVCGMAIADDEHATQIILENERSLKFDDLGDLYVWIDENGEDDIGEKFVRDFYTKEWLVLEDATFVFNEEIDTPMGFGVISFKDKTGAEEYIDEHDIGELLTASDLDNHEWEMEDHGDHHDHGDHDDHDHDDDDKNEDHD